MESESRVKPTGGSNPPLSCFRKARKWRAFLATACAKYDAPTGIGGANRARSEKRLFELPLSSASPSQIQQWFKENATPSTVGKAKAFFIALAKQTGIPMHSMVAKATRAASGSVRRKRKPKRLSALISDSLPDGEQSETPRRKEMSTPGASRAVSLREGAGVVTLTVSVNLWDLEGEDRDFVFGLMDALKRYEKGEGPASGPK